MTKDEIPAPFREALAYHEAFRKLGFEPEAIKYAITKSGRFYVVLQVQDQEFACLAGQFSPASGPLQVRRQWLEVVAQVGGDEISDSDLLALYEESYVYAHSVEFMMKLFHRGIRPPAEVSWEPVASA